MYTNEENEEWIAERRRRLWSEQSESVTSLLQVDNVAMYSVTEEISATRMAKILAWWVGTKAIVTDATACVGGNTAALAKIFSKVNAVEISSPRIEMLQNNLTVLGIRDKVTIYENDYTKIYKSIKQDVVFLDPPWGGPNYKQMRYIDLFLSDKNVANLAIDMLRWDTAINGDPIPPRASLIAIKAPLNYNINGLYYAVRNVGFNVNYCVHVIKINKMLFILVNAPWLVLPTLPPGFVDTGLYPI